MRLAIPNLVVLIANGVDAERWKSPFSRAARLDRALLCWGRGAPPAP